MPQYRRGRNVGLPHCDSPTDENVNGDFRLQSTFTSSAPICEICGEPFDVACILHAAPASHLQTPHYSMGLFGFCAAGTRGRRWLYADIDRMVMLCWCSLLFLHSITVIIFLSFIK